MKKVFFTIILILGSAMLFGQDINLPEPKAKLGIDLVDAINARKSARNFVKHEVAAEDLSTILWAANGLKKGADAMTSASKAGRTIPISGDVDYINVYLFNDKGAYAYDPANNQLKQIAGGDLRGSITPEVIKTAEFIILFTYDNTKVPVFLKGNPAMVSQIVDGSASYGAQNAALAAGAMKMNSIIMYNIKPKDIASILKLGKDEQPLFIMQVGYPQ